MTRIDYSKFDLDSGPTVEAFERTRNLRSLEPIEEPEDSQQEHTEPPMLLSVTEAAALLGVGKTNLYRLIKEEELQSIKIYGRRLISRQALEEFVHNQQRTAA